MSVSTAGASVLRPRRAPPVPGWPSVAVIVVALLAYLPVAPARLVDFRAFYCAGRAVALGADPYREHPLADCERTQTAPGMAQEQIEATVPAPLPGYVLAFFALLAQLPFAPCALLWMLASLGAIAASAWLIARALDVTPAAGWIVGGLPAIVVALPLGQLSPFAGLGLAACAFGLRAGRSALVVAGALLAALDPAVAVALGAALFAGCRSLRPWLLGGAAALAGLSFAALGPALNVEYVSIVLHAHASANVIERSQFSAAHLAWAAGLDPARAVTLGGVWYAISTAVGVWCALRLRHRHGPIALAVIPPAFAVFGGVYVHFAQLALALPGCLLVTAAATAGSRVRSGLCMAVFTLAIPWLALCAFPVFAIALVPLAAAFCHDLGEERITRRLGFGCAFALLLVFAVAATHFTHPAATKVAAVAGNPLAQESWRAYLATRDARPEPVVVLLQFPTLLALTSCLFVAVVTAARRARVLPT